METNHHIWQVWINSLHRWGLQNLVASFLEAAGPFAILGAQIIYVGEPILDSFVPDTHLQALANVLEDDVQRQAFVAILIEEPAL
jgi:hypothetical protein